MDLSVSKGLNAFPKVQCFFSCELLTGITSECIEEDGSESSSENVKPILNTLGDHLDSAKKKTSTQVIPNAGTGGLFRRSYLLAARRIALAVLRVCIGIPIPSLGVLMGLLNRSSGIWRMKFDELLR